MTERLVLFALASAVILVAALAGAARGREAKENKFLFSLWSKAQLCCAFDWPKAPKGPSAPRGGDAAKALDLSFVLPIFDRCYPRR